jgi:hypothetical protein
MSFTVCITAKLQAGAGSQAPSYMGVNMFKHDTTNQLQELRTKKYNCTQDCDLISLQVLEAENSGTTRV